MPALGVTARTAPRGREQEVKGGAPRAWDQDQTGVSEQTLRAQAAWLASACGFLMLCASSSTTRCQRTSNSMPALPRLRLCLPFSALPASAPTWTTGALAY